MLSRRLATVFVALLIALPTMVSVETTPAPPTVTQNDYGAGPCIYWDSGNSNVGTVVPWYDIGNGTYLRGAAGYLTYSQTLHACSEVSGAQNGETYIFPANLGTGTHGQGVQLGIGSGGPCGNSVCFVGTTYDGNQISSAVADEIPCVYSNLHYGLPIIGHKYEFLINAVDVGGYYDWEYRIIDRTAGITCTWYHGPATWVNATSFQAFYETWYGADVMDERSAPYNPIYNLFTENATSGWMRLSNLTIGWHSGPDADNVSWVLTSGSNYHDGFYVVQH